MSDETPSTSGIDKGKGKAVDVPEDISMDDRDEESSEEESGPEDHGGDAELEEDDEDEDGMEEIDTTNIVGGRTRGKVIDFAAADKETPEDDDDEDDDEDFEDPDDEDDKMQS